MSFSPARAVIFFLIGLPIGFILAGLGFAFTGHEISAQQIAPYAGAVALLIGIIAGLWKLEK